MVVFRWEGGLLLERFIYARVLFSVSAWVGWIGVSEFIVFVCDYLDLCVLRACVRLVLCYRFVVWGVVFASLF